MPLDTCFAFTRDLLIPSGVLFFRTPTSPAKFKRGTQQKYESVPYQQDIQKNNHVYFLHPYDTSFKQSHQLQTLQNFCLLRCGFNPTLV